MADNVVLNTGSGGETCATDDVAGVQYQRVKLTDGTADSSTVVAAGGGVEANALRVTIASDSTGVVSVDDNGGSLTVDGTVAATQSGTWNVTNVSGTVSLPTGAATAAKQPALGTAGTASADVISVQGIASMTPLQIEDNGGSITVDGSVSLGAAIPAGTNNIGDVDILSIAAGDNNIGNVDIVTMPNVTLAAGTNTNEVVGDAAHDAVAAGNPVLVGGYASATAPADVSADGDAVMLWALRNGSQVVNLAAGGSLIGATSNALDVNIKSGAGSGGTAMTDDAAFTPATTSITPMGALFDDVAPDSVDEGDGGAVRMSANRNLYVRIRDNAGNERGLNIDANGALAATVTNATATNLKAEVIGTGTFVVQNTAQASTNTQEMVGDVAHDAVAAGNPLLGGAYASAAAPADVSADGDAVRLWALRNGAQAIQPTFAGALAVAGNGASGTGVQRVTIANDSTGILATVTTVGTVTNITNQGQIADDAAFTAATTRVNMAGFFADETATDSVDEGDGGAARMTLDRKQIVTAYVHAAAGGASPYKNLDCDETEDDIKTSAGKLYWIHVVNLAATKRFIKFYNATAANVTVGTTTPVLSFPIPTMADTNGAGFTINFGDAGVQFDTAISVAATTGVADSDTGAPGANEVVLNAGYA